MHNAYRSTCAEANARKHILLDPLYAHMHISAMEDVLTTRKALSLTQEELADKLGLHQSTISRLESGALPLDRRTRLALEALAASAREAPTEVRAVG